METITFQNLKMSQLPVIHIYVLNNSIYIAWKFRRFGGGFVSVTRGSVCIITVLASRIFRDWPVLWLSVCWSDFGH